MRVLKPVSLSLQTVPENRDHVLFNAPAWSHSRIYYNAFGIRAFQLVGVDVDGSLNTLNIMSGLISVFSIITTSCTWQVLRTRMWT